MTGAAGVVGRRLVRAAGVRRLAGARAGAARRSAARAARRNGLRDRGGRHPRPGHARRARSRAPTPFFTWPRSSSRAIPADFDAINRRRHRQPGRRGRGGGRAPLRLRLVGVGGLPAPHALRRVQAGRGGDRRRRARGSRTPSCGRRWSTTRRAGRSSCCSARYLRRFPVVPFIGPGSARKRPVFSDDVVDGLAAHRRQRGLLRQDLQPERAASRSRCATLGKLILELEGRAAPVPAPAGAAVPGARRRRSARVMKDPPLTPYAVAGFTNDADLDCSEAMRRLRLCARSACAPGSPTVYPNKEPT